MYAIQRWSVIREMSWLVRVRNHNDSEGAQPPISRCGLLWGPWRQISTGFEAPHLRD